MEKPRPIFGHEWTCEGEVTRFKPRPVKHGVHYSMYELGAPVDVTIWDDGTATAETRGSHECASADEAVDVCEGYLRQLRDKLILATGMR